MNSQRLRELRAAVQNPLSEASALLWLRGAEEALSNRNFDAAFDRLMHAIIAVGEQNVDSETRSKLGVSALEIAIRSESVEHCREVLNSRAREWIHHGTASEVEAALKSVLALIDPNSPRALEMSDAFVNGFPMRAWPRLTRGYLRELNDDLGAFEDYVDAGQMLERHGLKDDANRACARAAAFGFSHDVDRNESKRIARKVDRSRLSYRERLWLALGWARSPAWLDQIRGVDVLEEIHDDLESDRIPGHQLDRDTFQQSSRAFFHRLPLILAEGALARVEEVVGVLPGARDAFSVRDAIASDRTDDESLAPFWAFRDLFPGHEGPPSAEHEQHAVAKFFRAMKFDDPEAANSALLEIERAVHAGQINAFPIAALIPHWLNQPTLSDATVTSIVRRFCASGREPSYGWVTLSTALAQSKLRHASVAACRRALRDGAQPNDLLKVAVSRSVDWAIREGSPSDLRFWLRHGRNLSDS